ncbi:hypothetical protein AVEN_259594-1 [Araneus ventricosus]|uniref:Uncharacterized protein n=1 Tax=Araneus ventricosus TaxID=182803 RepID=A0A4Y2EQE3_ARAVE|nr:hypothetical protein AVEN_259594-1 [Araneus ventricosus]
MKVVPKSLKWSGAWSKEWDLGPLQKTLSKFECDDPSYSNDWDCPTSRRSLELCFTLKAPECSKETNRFEEVFTIQVNEFI